MFEAFATDRGLAPDGRWAEQLMTAKTIRMQALLREGSPLYPGAAERIRELAGLVPMAIASGALRHEILMVLERAGLTPCFTAIVAAGETTRGKPAPEPYARAVELLGRSAGRRNGSITGRGGGGHDTGTRLRAGGTAPYDRGDHHVSARGGGGGRCRRGDPARGHRAAARIARGRRCVQAAGNRTVLGVDPVSPRNLVVQIRRRDHPAVKVAEVEFLVRRVRVLVRQADPEKHRGNTELFLKRGYDRD